MLPCSSFEAFLNVELSKHVSSSIPLSSTNTTMLDEHHGDFNPTHPKGVGLKKTDIYYGQDVYLS